MTISVVLASRTSIAALSDGSDRTFELAGTVGAFSGGSADPGAILGLILAVVPRPGSSLMDLARTILAALHLAGVRSVDLALAGRDKLDQGGLGVVALQLTEESIAPVPLGHVAADASGAWVSLGDEPAQRAFGDAMKARLPHGFADLDASALVLAARWGFGTWGRIFERTSGP